MSAPVSLLTMGIILVSIKAERELYKTLFSENGDPHFPSRIFASCYKKYASVEDDKRFQQLKPSEQKFFFCFVAQGCSGILSQWLEDGMTEPVDEVADFADKLVQSTLKSI